MIFNEEVYNETAATAQLFASKLKNMRQHLQALASKKARIEIEIRELKKSIADKEKNYERNLKLKLAIEQDQNLTREQASILREESPVLFNALVDLTRELDLCHKAIEYYEL